MAKFFVYLHRVNGINGLKYTKYLVWVPEFWTKKIVAIWKIRMKK